MNSKHYDKGTDLYRYFYELAPIDNPTSGTLAKVAEIEAGTGPDRKTEPGMEDGVVRANDRESSFSIFRCWIYELMCA